MIALAGVAAGTGRHNVPNVVQAALADRIYMLDLHVAAAAAVGATIAELIEPLAERCHRNLNRSLPPVLSLASLGLLPVVEPQIGIDLILKPPAGLRPLSIVCNTVFWMLTPVAELLIHHQTGNAWAAAGVTDGLLQSSGWSSVDPLGATGR